MPRAKYSTAKKGKVMPPALIVDAPSVTQVVEVVEEVKEEPVVENVTQEDVADVENPEEKEVTPVAEEKPEPHDEEMVPEMAHTKNREVVEEIFAKDNGRLAEEMVMDVKENMAGVYWWAIAVISCVLTIGGILIVVNARDKVSFSLPFFTSPSPTSVPVPTGTPTPLPPLRSDIKVQVLNGAGVLGVAGKMKSFLEEKGYVVVSTGNAKSYEYDETVLQVSAGRLNIADLLKSDLKADYKVASEVAEFETTDDVDAVVIVGKK